MVREKLVELLKEAAATAQERGKLPRVSLPDITIERPQNPEHGDYATNLPLRLARASGANPMIIARELTALVPRVDEVQKVVAAPPGFINFTLSDSWLACQVDEIISAGDSYGANNAGTGRKVQVEFVSINPTGPLHVGHGRGAVLGSTLANVLATSGWQVEKEYYFNDAGSQMDAFRRSLYARYLQALGAEKELPANGYHGSYMIDIAREIIAAHGDRFKTLPEEQAVERLGEIGVRKVMDKIKEELELLRVEYDVFFSEQSLYRDGQYKKVLAILKKDGYLADKEGATWFVSTALGEDKDNVVIRSDGSPTYFAADIAYHYSKFVERGFDRVINVWGADHQGHVSRLKAVVGAMGIDPARLTIIIHQMVTLKRGGELVRISKRTGDIITLREVMDEVGVDACRYFFLARSANSQMDFDLELAKKQSQDNPVYYIQYAHARIASIMRLAEERHITFHDGDASLLKEPAELTLIRKLLQLPEIIETIAATLEPHHLAYYAQDLATVFHLFYRDCRVVTDNVPLTKARLKLVEAARIALARTLNLMSMTAPDKM
jgi:arginyl-tRNA synthetase